MGHFYSCPAIVDWLVGNNARNSNKRTNCCE